MNPFGMTAGDIPDETMDRGFDAATVFKNFTGCATIRREARIERHGSQGVSSRREFVVEVKKSKRLVSER